MSIFQGSSGNILTATVYNTDGSVKTDLAHNSAGISVVVKRLGRLDSSALTLAEKAAANSAHSPGAFLNLGNGRISIDIADALFAGYTGQVWISGSFTGGQIVGDREQVTGYNPAAVAVGANTVAPNNALLATVAEYVDTEVAAIKAKTDNLPSDPADASVIADSFTAIAASIATANGSLSSLGTLLAALEVAAIKAKTDNLPSDPADASVIADSFAAIATTLSAISDAIDEIDVSGASIDAADVALRVYRRLAGGSVGLLAGPTSAGPLDVVHSADLDYTFDADVAADSELVFTIRRDVADSAPALEILDDVLVTLNGSSPENPGDGEIERLSATQCRVLIRARSLQSLAPGDYVAEVRELTVSGETKDKLELALSVRRAPSRRIAE
jgi:hypothetical protein